jgi:hypothetical protein
LVASVYPVKGEPLLGQGFLSKLPLKSLPDHLGALAKQVTKARIKISCQDLISNERENSQPAFIGWAFCGGYLSGRVSRPYKQ